jgi:hypothetical protein
MGASWSILATCVHFAAVWSSWRCSQPCLPRDHSPPLPARREHKTFGAAGTCESTARRNAVPSRPEGARAGSAKSDSFVVALSEMDDDARVRLAVRARCAAPVLFGSVSLRWCALRSLLREADRGPSRTSVGDRGGDDHDVGRCNIGRLARRSREEARRHALRDRELFAARQRTLTKGHPVRRQFSRPYALRP